MNSIQVPRLHHCRTPRLHYYDWLNPQMQDQRNPGPYVSWSHTFFLSSFFLPSFLPRFSFPSSFLPFFFLNIWIKSWRGEDKSGISENVWTRGIDEGEERPKQQTNENLRRASPSYAKIFSSDVLLAKEGIGDWEHCALLGSYYHQAFAKDFNLLLSIC